MPERPIQRALISVYDKTGIVEFARALVDEFGVEIISTGGTAKHLREHGIPVTLVEEITGFPELLDGRVKTLHPKIHAAILADRDNPEHMRRLAEQGIRPIDMVVVNLYPFEKAIADPNCTFEQAIEMIDIGGPCLLRAAAKNHKNVVVLSGSIFYESTLSRLRSDRAVDWNDLHTSGAEVAFTNTAAYDARVAAWLSSRNSSDGLPTSRFIELFCWGKLRYGENPHQQAELLERHDEGGDSCLVTADASWECDVPMSFNNFLDADSALRLGRDLDVSMGRSPCCVFVKHTNACGVGVSDDPLESYRRAYLGDANAAMGGILAVNFSVSANFAESVLDSLQKWGKVHGATAFFIEVWLATGFEDDAVEVIRTRKLWGSKVRLLEVGDFAAAVPTAGLEYRAIVGGFLGQSPDLVGLNEDQWKVVTRRAPSESEISNLRLAWLIAKHTKSNAISICKDGMLIGNGAGQMSRVMSCRIATWLAKENGHAEKLAGAAAASDAFFPFADGPKLLIDAGVRAIIQPGGSKRDGETIAACDERDVAMIFTGTRHFKH